MNAFLIGGVILVAILVFWLALQSLQSRQKSGAIESHVTGPKHRTIGDHRQGRRAAPR